MPSLPDKTDGRRRWASTPAIAPFVIALAVFALGRPVLAFGIVVLASVLLVVRLVWPSWADRIDRVLTRIGQLIAAAVSMILLGLVFALVVVPVWTISRLARWNALVSGPDGWLSDRSHPLRLRKRTFQRERFDRPLRSRIAGLAVGVLSAALLAAGVTGAAVLARADGRLSEFTAVGPRATGEPDGVVYDDVWYVANGTPVSRRSFPGEPTARAALIDHDENANQTMSPDYGWLNVDIASTHFNVVDGTRVTRSPPGEPEATVWMFGGSTTYGFGQRDEHTIASALVAEAESHGRSVEVVNRGVNAYVNAQETDVFEDLLASGERPDVAVFLDGCNENALGFERERYGLLDTDETYTLASTTELQDERAEAARRAGWEETHDLDRQAELAAPQYARGVRRARAVAEEYGVAAVHFWQPMFVNLHRDDPMVPTVAHNLEVGLDFMALSRESYARARKLSGVDPIDISDSLAGASVPTFFDFCHTNEAGARLEAEAMWPHVEAFLPRA